MTAVKANSRDEGHGAWTTEVEVRDGGYPASSSLEIPLLAKERKIQSFITCLWPPLYSVPSSCDSRMLELILVLASPLPSPPFTFPAHRKTDA